MHIQTEETIMTALSLKTILAAGIAAATIAMSSGPASAMNKQQLIDAMAKDANISKAQAQSALDSFINTTTKALKKGDRVALVGFGSFSVSQRSSRSGRNPQTGREIKIAAKKVVKFKAGAALGNAVK
jgi:DNA-binding protein HU-beta